MSIQIVCSHCKKAYLAADKLAGQRIKCLQCGAAIEAPLLPAEAEPAPESRANVAAGARFVAQVDLLEDLAGDDAITDPGSVSSPSAATVPSDGDSSEMRGELDAVFTAGGLGPFAASHKLMLADVVLAILIFVVCIGIGRFDLAALGLLAGFGIAASGFLRLSEEMELRAAQAVFCLCCFVTVLTAFYLFCRWWQRLPADSIGYAAFLVFGVIAGTAVVLTLAFSLCSLIPRAGIYPVLGWGYLCVACFTPVMMNLRPSLPDFSIAIESPAPEEIASDVDDPDEPPAPPEPVSGPPKPPEPSAAPSEPDKETPSWTVTADSLGQPHRALAAQPVDLGIGAENILQVMFSAPETAGAVVLSRPSQAARPWLTEEEPETPSADEDDSAPKAAAGTTNWLDVYDLVSGRHLRRIQTPQTSQLVDVSRDGKEAVLVTSDRLDVWSLEKKKQRLEHEGCFLSDRGIARILWAAFVGKEHLATLDTARNLVVWSLHEDFRKVYELKEISLATVSPGRKYLVTFAPKRNGVLEACLREAVSDEVLEALELPASVQGMPLSCAFRGDGERLALWTRSGIIVWDITKGVVLGEHKPPNAGNRMVFFDWKEDFLLLDKSLFSPQHKQVVWSYDTSGSPLDHWDKVVGSPDGHLWKIAPQTSPPTTYLVPLDIPDDQHRKELLKASAGEIQAMTNLRSKISVEPPDAKSYDQASQAYAQKVVSDLIVGDDATLQNNLWWFPAGNRPCIGLRWGLAVERTVKQPELIPPAELQKSPRPVAIMAGLQERINQGSFGRWPRLGDTRLRQLTLLGGDPKELLATARRHAVDVLVVVNLSPRFTKKGPIEETKARILDVFGPKELLWASKSKLIPIEPGKIGIPAPPPPPSKPIAKVPMRSAPPPKPVKSSVPKPTPSDGTDLGAEFVAELLEYVDESCLLKPMQAITVSPENAQKRVNYLLAKRSAREDDWRLLLESRYYQSQQLLAADEAIPFYEAVLGPGKGSALAADDEPARFAVLHEWLDRGNSEQNQQTEQSDSANQPTSAASDAH